MSEDQPKQLRWCRNKLHEYDFSVYKKCPECAAKYNVNREGRIKLSKINRRLLITLNKESKALESASMMGELDRDQKRALVDYLKLLKELQKQEKEAIALLSDEELEALAKEEETK